MDAVVSEIDAYLYVREGGCLLASWADYIRSESDAFLDSIEDLLRILMEEKIEKLYLTSGTPLGGTLTEPVIDAIEKSAPLLSLKRIALLESLDFHWDNNVLLTLNYVKTLYNLSLEIESFLTEELALKWLLNE